MEMRLVRLDQPGQLLLLRELWGSSMKDAETRIEKIITANVERLQTSERLTVQALCEIARQLARLAGLKEFEIGLEEEDLEEIVKVEPEGINPPPAAAKEAADQ